MAGVLSAAGLASPRKREYGHWSEVVSSAGKVYYYNRVTEQSQWIKPDGWEKAESVIFPVIDRIQRNREESGFSDTIQTDSMLSDDDMDVSYGDSPMDLSSSPSSSIDEIPLSSEEDVQNIKEEIATEANRIVEKYIEENEIDEKAIDDNLEEEGEPYTPTDKYYRADLVLPLHEKFNSSDKDTFEAIRSSCAFEIEFATQQTQMYRARALARTAMAKALESQTEVTTLSNIQQHLEDSRQHFQANFDSEMRRILRGPNEKLRMDDYSMKYEEDKSGPHESPRVRDVFHSSQ